MPGETELYLLLAAKVMKIMAQPKVRTFFPYLLFVLIGLIIMFASTNGDDLSVLDGRAAGPAADQVTQHGITWTFDTDYEVGQFANGDYWVVGPVTIVAIDPPSVIAGGRTMHGSMINPSPLDGSDQGYDSAMYGTYGPAYTEGLNAARPNGQDLTGGNPLVVPSGSSLVSTISHPNPGERPQLLTAAILTVVDAVVPAGSFRPPYSGNDKSVPANISQIDADKLEVFAPVPSTPTMATVERYFERPWIDHVPNWTGRYIHPSDNMPDYGRDMASRVGEGALMLHLNFPYAEKESLLIRYLQLGIDWYGVLLDGGENNWPPNGGHASGRKWPIVFAGLVLGIDGMKDVGPGDGAGKIGV